MGKVKSRLAEWLRSVRGHIMQDRPVAGKLHYVENSRNAEGL